MKLRIRLTPSIAILLSSFLMASHAHSGGTIKCWQNAEKIRECGRMVPPEFAQGRIEVLNAQGQVIKVYERVLTKEERKEARRIAKLKKQEERRKEESRKHDVILMMTFSTEAELAIAHKNKVEALQGILKLTEANNISLDDKLHTVQKQLANYERAGEKAPPGLYEKMNTIKSKIKINNKSLKDKKLQIENLNTQYHTDLQRYKELKSYQRSSRVKNEDDDY